MDAPWLKILPSGLSSRIRGEAELQAVLNNSRRLAAERLVRLLIGVPITVWLARYLGPDAFGLLSYAIAFVAIFAAIAAAGMERIAVRELVRDDEGAGRILATAFAIRVVLALVAVLAAVLAVTATPDGDPRVFWLVVVIAAGMVVRATDVIDYWNQARLQSKSTVRARLAGFLVASAFRVWLILSGGSLLAFAFASLAETVVGAGFLVSTHLRGKAQHPKYRISVATARSLVRESWPLLLAGLAITLYMRIDIVMLQYMTDAREVGIYASAVRLSEVWYALPVILASSAFPAILRSREVDYGQYLARIRGLYFLFCWMAIAISLPASIFSGSLVSGMYGGSYADAAPVLSIHLWGSLGVFLGVASSQYLLAENMQVISMYRTIIGMISNILLNLLLIPMFQAKGAAIATVVSYLISTFSIALFPKTRAHAVYLLLSPVYARRPVSH
jgi:PST family polysaccharide transporter